MGLFLTIFSSRIHLFVFFNLLGTTPILEFYGRKMARNTEKADGYSILSNRPKFV